MFYYIYQITNIVNNKIYVGVHKTKDINDGYMGSGKIIKRAIEKHGIDNFRKEILEQFDSAEAMLAKEKEIVTDEFLARDDVYNLRCGGFGGFDYINKNKLYGFSDSDVARRGRVTTDNLLLERYGPDWRKKISELGRIPGKIAFLEKYKTDSDFRDKMKKSQLKAMIAAQSPVSKQKRLDTFKNTNHQKGVKNSQFGSQWITDGKSNSKIKNTEDIPNGWRLGRTSFRCKN